MKRFIIICILLFVGISQAAWDKDKPASSTSLRSSNPEILANWSALESAIGQDHEFSTGGTNTGKHLQITFDANIADPTVVAATEGVLYLKTVSGKSELHFIDEDENILQLTSAGDLFSSTGLTVTNNATFNGNLIGSSTSDITFNTNKFTVAGATGNTLIAGTLDVTGIMTTTAASVLGDGSTLAAATESGDGDRTISDKAYVDSRGYHDRGDPASVDFQVGDLVTDGTWRDLDLSSIVPVGATAVSLKVALQDDAVNSAVLFRKNGNSNIFTSPAIDTQVANVTIRSNLIVSCDTNRIIEYNASNLTFTTINITVLGWWD